MGKLTVQHAKNIVGGLNEDNTYAIGNEEFDDDALKWLEESGYHLKRHASVYCVAKSEQDLPSDETMEKLKQQMEEKLSDYWNQQDKLLIRQFATLRLIRMGVLGSPIKP